jgi:hypothetical protein
MKTIAVVVVALMGLSGSASAAIKYAVHTYLHEGSAHKHCPTDEVVYGKPGTYYQKGHHDYGHVKSGRYFCRGEADKEGWRAAK